MTTLFFPKDSYDFSQGSCIALGNFDGVHIAHQDLIKRAIYIAENRNLISVVYTFDRHPRNLLENNIKVLTTIETKTDMIDTLGVDVVAYQNLTEDFLKVEPEDFVKKYLVDILNVKHVVVGKHYTFGHKSQGNVQALLELGKKYGFNVDVLNLIYNENTLISSTNIRSLLTSGDVELANNLLGRQFYIEGIIEQGGQIGRQIGFPTINIYAKDEWLLPKFGVYAVKIELDGKIFKGIANVGIKPTVNDNRPVIETNIFDYNDDCYGKKAKIMFLHFIRAETKFSSIDELKNQITKDKKTALKFFN